MIIENFQAIHINKDWVQAKYKVLGNFTTECLEAATLGTTPRFAIRFTQQPSSYAIAFPLPDDNIVVSGFRVDNEGLPNPSPTPIGAQVALGRIVGQALHPLVTLSINLDSVSLNYARLSDDGVSYVSEEVVLPIPIPEPYIDFSISRGQGNNFTLYIANAPAYVGNLLPADNTDLYVVYGGAIPKEVTAPYLPVTDFATATPVAGTLPIVLGDFYVGDKRVGSPEVYTTYLEDVTSTQTTNTGETPGELIARNILKVSEFIGGEGVTSATVTRDTGVIDDGQITMFSQQNVPDGTRSVEVTVGSEAPVGVVPQEEITASTFNFRRYPNVKLEVN